LPNSLPLQSSSSAISCLIKLTIITFTFLCTNLHIKQTFQNSVFFPIHTHHGNRDLSPSHALYFSTSPSKIPTTQTNQSRKD
ncbi:hypothetical protein VIGAN_06171800, partial [Vigna angularis var. angularis]